jgi:hypothetical protein
MPVLLFGVFVITALLLALVVWWLQRHERHNRLDSVERSGELPPLATGQMPDFSPLPPALAPAAAANAWQDQVKKLKDNGEYELALVLCQQQFPKAQAFQQAAILLRLQMKQALDQQQDLNPLLVRLYRCAVLADLFRSGAALKPPNPRQALKGLATHEFPYLEVGHRQLKLLSKSDARLLEARWGEPRQHQHAETALGSQWENLCR